MLHTEHSTRKLYFTPTFLFSVCADATLMFLESSIHFHFHINFFIFLPLSPSTLWPRPSHTWPLLRFHGGATAHLHTRRRVPWICCTVLLFSSPTHTLCHQHLQKLSNCKKKEITQTFMKSNIFWILYSWTLHLLNISSASPHMQCATGLMNLFFIFFWKI